MIDAVARILENASRLLFITGAGISADSGLPTYRGIGGLYEDACTDEGLPIEQALSGTMFRTRPELTWKYIAELEAAHRGAAPNRAHRVIAELESKLSDVWVLTQNVDGLHHRAGSRNIIDIHGDIHSLSCTACPYQARVVNYAELSIPPQCPDCDGLVRPDVILFGELLPESKLELLSRASARPFDAVLSVGTSSLFPYIEAPVLGAHRAGIPTVEINPGQTHLSSTVDYKVSMGAADALGAIAEKLGLAS